MHHIDRDIFYLQSTLTLRCLVRHHILRILSGDSTTIMSILDFKGLFAQTKSIVFSAHPESEEDLELKRDMNPVVIHHDTCTNDTSATIIAFNRYRNKK
ncbi:MAG: hypothetical protein ACI8V0_000927 [Pseudohongiellaceae bacterium]|jgi:hypothetical protein